MTKVLITGAYGFLGKAVVKEFVDNGYHVIAFGRNEEKLNELKSENVDTFLGDFTVPEDINKACEGVDYVIHCGAYLKAWGRKEDFIKGNVEGTRNVLNACKLNNVKRLVYCSSPSCNPKKDSLSFKEEDYNVNNKINFYVESKIQAEAVLKNQTEMPYSIIRPRGLCGIGDKMMVPTLININKSIGIPLFHKGTVIVDLCAIENVALALRLCMEKDEALHQIYNITNGEPRNIKDLCEEMMPKLDITPKYCKLPFAPIYAFACVAEWWYKLFHLYKKGPVITRHDLCTIGRTQVFDISKAKRELGYEPKVTLAQMFDAYAEDYKKNHQVDCNSK